MDKHPIGELMETTMQKIREMVDVNTIVGEPIITADGITLIPISKVSFGFASGGSDFQGKNTAAQNNFGGGSGAGVSIVPVAFLVVKGESVKLIPVAPPASTTIDRVIETVPEVIDRVSDFIKKDKKPDGNA
jgi:sporulation protein YtfJ